MLCPKCKCQVYIKNCQYSASDSKHPRITVCNNSVCVFYDSEINFVNPDDINDSFWKHDYLILLTRFGIAFVINADHEQDAIDFMIDYIESRKWDGLLLDYNDPDDLELIESDEYICGGNHGRYLSTYHIAIDMI